MRLLRFGFLVAATLSLAGPPQHSDITLTRLARVAELYRDTALGFACEESIEYRGDRSGSIQFAYLFTHDETGRFRDFRTWRTGTTAEARGEEVDPLRYRVPRFLQSAYLWAFVFRADRQPLHTFFNLGDDTAHGRRAIKLGFQPNGPIVPGKNDWAGVFWIDRETTQILRVEAWSPEDWNAKVKRDADLADAPNRKSSWRSEPYDIESIVTEFTEVRNGMRFPGKVTIDRTVFTVLGGTRDFQTKERLTYHVTQEYSRYKFFSVRSEDEIKRFVAGGGALQPSR